MSAPLRLGLVGAGAIARDYAKAIQRSTAANLVAVADTDANAAVALAQDTGAVAFGSHLELVTKAVCDAVLVTTPPVTHAPIVIDLVSRGIPVLCEKPLSVDMASALAMVSAAVQNEVLLMMASKFRFVDDVISAQEMVLSGEIGTPLIFENAFTGVVDMRERWNSNPSISGGGVLVDNGTHSADIVRLFLGPITEVFATAGPRLQPIDVEDSVTLIARTKTGAQATIETSWSLHKDRSAYIGIYGNKGAIELGWKESRIRRAPGSTWEAFGSGYDKVAAFTRQIEHLASVLRGAEQVQPNTDEILASVAVVRAGYASMASGSWSAVEDIQLHASELVS